MCFVCELLSDGVWHVLCCCVFVRVRLCVDAVKSFVCCVCDLVCDVVWIDVVCVCSCLCVFVCVRLSNMCSCVRLNVLLCC